jgi:cobalamin biosynthesis Mg chelatase CobN
MRALPNLKEMNVSNNKLTNLIGLELLPSIQAISAGGSVGCLFVDCWFIHSFIDHYVTVAFIVLMCVLCSNIMMNECVPKFAYCSLLSCLILFNSLFYKCAENNAITTIQIPQNYMSHLNKVLDKDGCGSTSSSSSSKSKAGKGDNASTAVASVTSASGVVTKASSRTTSGNKPASSNSSTNAGKSRATRKSGESQVSDDVTKSNSKSLSAPAPSPVVGLQFLTELYLSGNSIESLAGMEAYGTVW